MCFFKAKLPEAVNPVVTAAVPEDATAPEPNAPVFGWTEKALMDAGGETKGKTGISSIKIGKTGKSSLVMPTTGVNPNLSFNGQA